MTYNNGSAYTFTWTQGRRLATAVKGSNTLSFTYNSDGIRTSKIVNGTKHTYVLNGTSVYSDTWIVGTTTHIIVYVYDDSGSPIGMLYRNSTMAQDAFEYYIFAKNPQGDITAVYSASGILLVQYRYDAWGNVTTTYYNGGASTAVQYNSFRYRGYFYDSELNLYYLNSRYYDPATGRFLNADVYINANGDLTGFNMFAYCSNNPVMGYDPMGQGFFSDWWNGLCQDVSAAINVIYDSIVFDAGVGMGFGGSAEVDSAEVTAIVRNDFISINKEAGGDFQLGSTEEVYAGVSAFATFVGKGHKHFYDEGYEYGYGYKGSPEVTQIEPHPELTWGFTVKSYFIVGFTFSVQFDLGYIIDYYN